MCTEEENLEEICEQEGKLEKMCERAQRRLAKKAREGTYNQSRC